VLVARTVPRYRLVGTVSPAVPPRSTEPAVAWFAAAKITGLTLYLTALAQPRCDLLGEVAPHTLVWWLVLSSGRSPMGESTPAGARCCRLDEDRTGRATPVCLSAPRSRVSAVSDVSPPVQGTPPPDALWLKRAISDPVSRAWSGRA
jgi:hypothetical protein